MLECDLANKGFVLQKDGSYAKVNRSGGSWQTPVVEPGSGDGILGKKQVEAKDSGRVLVRVTSLRRRLLDEDNLCEKFHVDCCRYAGLIPGDSPEKAKIEVSQVKVGMKDREFVRIEIGGDC